MKLDLGSFAFGSTITSGGNTPSWGTSLGQIKPDLKLTCPGYDNIVIGMVYKSIPVDKVYIPLGKGGHVYNSLEDEGIQLAAMFDKVYINEVRVNAPFIMLIYKEDSDSWRGRKTLKYSPKIEYRRGNNDIVYNSDFVNAAIDALQVTDDACWLISDIYIINQNELHMIAGIVNPYKSETYPTAELRKAAFINAIKTTYDDNPHFKRLSGANNCDYDDRCKSLQQIFYGAPGTGKSNTIKREVDDKGKLTFRTTFHPDSDYSTFVGTYKPSMKPTGVTLASGEREEVITYKFIPQTFTRAYVEAWKTTDDVFLVIEEINRGNCAQIFGDLFQLLDRKDGVSEYPVEADTDLAIYLAEVLAGSKRDDIPSEVKNGTKLKLPSNLFIWATMNTSDQSLFPIDSAFKRRWEWKYMKIKNEGKEWKIDTKIKYENGEEKLVDWWDFIRKVNEIIASMTSSADKQLGYFFCKADKKTLEKANDPNSENDLISLDTFVSKVLFYLWNDVFKDYGFEDASLFQYIKTEDGKETKKDLTFPDFYREDSNEVNSTMVTDFVQKVMNWKKKVEENI